MTAAPAVDQQSAIRRVPAERRELTLHCRPVGRGNWRLVRLTLSDYPADLFTFAPEDRFAFGGQVLRVVRVLL